MQTEEIKKFLELIKNTDIEELFWESNDSKISLKRADVTASQQSPQQEQQKNGQIEGQKKQDTPMFNGKTVTSIKSPIVGIFYRAESSDHPPLVMEGGKVISGQRVAIIEAMKIMRDVLSPVKGKIVKILVENGHPVQYGQDLFHIDTEEPK